MHIREGNNKVLDKSAIKKGGHFSRGSPFNILNSLNITQQLCNPNNCDNSSMRFKLCVPPGFANLSSTVDLSVPGGLAQLGLLHEQRLLEKDRELAKLQQEIKHNQKQILVGHK